MKEEPKKNSPQESWAERGWTRVPPKMTMEAFLTEFPDAVIREGYAFSADRWEGLIREAAMLGADPEGCDLGGLSRELKLSRAALKPVLSFLEEKERGTVKRGRFYGAEDFRLRELSPFDKANLALLKEAGIEGLEAERIKIQGILPSLERLAAKGFAVALTETLFWDTQVLKEMQTKLMEGAAPGDSLSITDARERTGLSRRFLLPLFASLEAEGFLRREEDVRVVGKRFGKHEEY